MQSGVFVRAHVIEHDPGPLPWSMCGPCSSMLINTSPLHLAPQNIAADLQAVTHTEVKQALAIVVL